MSNDHPNLQRASAPTPRVEVIADAVIMAYIHEISARHGRTAGATGTPGAVSPAA